MASYSCFSCRTTQDELPNPLLNCAACHNIFHCSIECQKFDWKSHKKLCGSDPLTRFVPTRSHKNPNTTILLSTMLSIDIANNLQKCSQVDVFCFLVDCFRIREKDTYTFQGVNVGSMNPFEGSPYVKDFSTFLNRRISTGSFAKAVECGHETGMRGIFRLSVRRILGEYKDHGHAEGSVAAFTEKAEIHKHCGDSMMPMILRMLAEKIYNSSVKRYYISRTQRCAIR